MKEQPKAIRLKGSEGRGRPVTIIVDGQPVKAFAGESIAAALMADGRWICQSDNDRQLGVFCNIGVCHSCLMTVDGVNSVRTCKTPVSEGCTVETRRFSHRPEGEPGDQSRVPEDQGR